MSNSEHPKNQLDKVICQIRFPPLLSIDRNIDLFQEKIRINYPKYVMEQIVPIGVANPPGAGHIFLSTDEKWSFNISTGAISLTTNDYRDWDDFERRFFELFNIFCDLFNIDTFSRIGLRYINAISPRAIGLDNDVRYILKGPIADYYSSSLGTFKGGSCILDRDLDKGISSRTIVGTIVFTNGEPGFAIDNDIFTCQPVIRDNIADYMGRFNELANILFKEVASETLCEKVGL